MRQRQIDAARHLVILYQTMRLKQVEIHGFKTFANRTEFLFGEGITAIVGPNGCGKSNIADAIRWALGEQSPSNLRTKKTEDLIFTGSAVRSRMGMAEVALTLENPFSLAASNEASSDNGSSLFPTTHPSSLAPHPSPDHNGDEQRPRGSIVEEILRARPSEVTILRRAYRSGENEYLINRQRVRLRDVQELLQRWGLARLTYAVIGQGLIDQALSLRAEERRALFEEAAGIGLYQTKKANALEKLEETQQNLIRVNDIINEIAPRLPSLARQADRASKYESVATTLNEKLRQWYAFQWAHAQEGFISAQAEETSAREKLTELRAAMHDLSAQLTDARRTAQALRVKLADHRRVQQQSENEFATRERELAVLEERARFTETQYADAQRDLEIATAAAQAAQQAYDDALNSVPTEPEPTLEQSAPLTLDTLESQTPEPDAEDHAEHIRIAETARAADADQVILLGALAAAEHQSEAKWLAETERLTQLAQQEEAEQRAQAEQHAAQLENERVQVEHQRARALAKLRLAEQRLNKFENSLRRC